MLIIIIITIITMIIITVITIIIITITITTIIIIIIIIIIIKISYVDYDADTCAQLHAVVQEDDPVEPQGWSVPKVARHRHHKADVHQHYGHTGPGSADEEPVV